MTDAINGKIPLGPNPRRIEIATRSWGKGSIIGSGQSFTGKSSNPDSSSVFKAAAASQSKRDK